MTVAVKVSESPKAMLVEPADSDVDVPIVRRTHRHRSADDVEAMSSAAVVVSYRSPQEDRDERRGVGVDPADGV